MTADEIRAEAIERMASVGPLRTRHIWDVIGPTLADTAQFRRAYLDEPTEAEETPQQRALPRPSRRQR